MMTRDTHNKGIAVFMSLMMLLLLSLLVVATLLSSSNYTNIVEKHIKRLKAMVSAEAGINYAYWKLRTEDPADGVDDPPWTIKPDPNSYNVVITVTGGPFPSRYTIKSKVIY